MQDFDFSDDSVSDKVTVVDQDYSNISLAYTDMMYYIVVTVTSTGYGDVLPKNGLEYLVTILVVMSGMYIHGYAIANIKEAVNLAADIINFENDLLDSLDSVIINMDTQRRMTFNKEVINPYAKFIPVIWNCKLAHSSIIKHDAVRLFQSNFFLRQSDHQKQDIFDRYCSGIFHKFSGIFKLFKEVFGYELFCLMTTKVYFHLIRFFKGQTILKKDQFSDSFYLLYTGKIDLMYDESSSTPLLSLSEGGILGDSMLINEPELMTSM